MFGVVLLLAAMVLKSGRLDSKCKGIDDLGCGVGAVQCYLEWPSHMLGHNTTGVSPYLLALRYKNSGPGEQFFGIPNMKTGAEDEFVMFAHVIDVLWYYGGRPMHSSCNNPGWTP